MRLEHIISMRILNKCGRPGILLNAYMHTYVQTCMHAYARLCGENNLTCARLRLQAIRNKLNSMKSTKRKKQLKKLGIDRYLQIEAQVIIAITAFCKKNPFCLARRQKYLRISELSRRPGF